MKDTEQLNFKNTKVLVFGLGLLGGGVAVTNWLMKHGAIVTVTDLKSKDYLEPSLKRLKGKPKLRLNGHDKKDIEDNEIIVFNPDISINNPFVKYARELGKRIENEATIFYRLCPRPIIAVTGTRGKTTTANWVGHFLNAKSKAVVSGNSYIEPLLKTLDTIGRYATVVNEIPSYHLEYFDESIKAPEIAVVTNLFQDHLNRHRTMDNYALAKAMIFQNQSVGQNLILNYDNEWTPFFLKQKPKSKIWLFSLSPLPKKAGGVFSENDKIYFQENGIIAETVDIKGFVAKWGSHNLQNLLASSFAAHLNGVSWAQIQKRIRSLPQIPFRQEIIFNGYLGVQLLSGGKKSYVKIINDTSATSPDGGIAAIRRFGGPNTILITGGTDRELDYAKWAKVVKQKLKPENVIFLAGSATDKMLKVLGPKFKVGVCDSLEKCFKTAISKSDEYPKSVILFSPAAKSFEKFKNEYDRGRKFNALVKRIQS